MLKRRLFMAAAVLLSGVGAVAATDVLMEGVDTARTGSNWCCCCCSTTTTYCSSTECELRRTWPFNGKQPRRLFYGKQSIRGSGTMR